MPVNPEACHTFVFAHKVAKMGRAREVSMLCKSGTRLETVQPRLDAEMDVSVSNLLCANCHQEETRVRNTVAS